MLTRGFFFFQAEDGIRDLVRSRGLGDVYKRQQEAPVRQRVEPVRAPGASRRAAITRRPWLMSTVGCRTEHAEQTTITLTGPHAYFEKARAALMLSLIHISEPTRPY